MEKVEIGVRGFHMSEAGIIREMNKLPVKGHASDLIVGFRITSNEWGVIRMISLEIRGHQ